MLLNELFEVKNGLTSSRLKITEQRKDNSIAIIRPSSSWQNIIIGFADKTSIDSKYIFPSETLVVSTNGEGSHTYSYVCPFEFVPNSDISALIPKKPLSVQEKIFYAMCITQNRYKFSYGRKPKGKRLKSLELPSEVPNWAKSASIPSYLKVPDGKPENTVTFENLVTLSELFDITYGNKFDLNKMVQTDKADESGVLFISRTGKNLGFAAKVKPSKKVSPFPSGCITVALGGSILSSFVQQTPFYTAQNIAVLKPKNPQMSLAEKIFYCMCIEKNRFRYTTFGREANRTLRTLLVPNKAPSWIDDRIVQKYLGLG